MGRGVDDADDATVCFALADAKFFGDYGKASCATRMVGWWSDTLGFTDDTTFCSAHTDVSLSKLLYVMRLRVRVSCRPFQVPRDGPLLFDCPLSRVRSCMHAHLEH